MIKQERVIRMRERVNYIHRDNVCVRERDRGREKDKKEKVRDRKKVK